MTHEGTGSQLQPGQLTAAGDALLRRGCGGTAQAQAQTTLQHTAVPVGLRLQEWHPFFLSESSAPQVQELGPLPLTSLDTQLQNCGQGLWALSRTLEEAVMRTSI